MSLINSSYSENFSGSSFVNTPSRSSQSALVGGSRRARYSTGTSGSSGSSSSSSSPEVDPDSVRSHVSSGIRSGAKRAFDIVSDAVGRNSQTILTSIVDNIFKRLTGNEKEDEKVVKGGALMILDKYGKAKRYNPQISTILKSPGITQRQAEKKIQQFLSKL